MAHSNGSKIKLSLALTALLTMQFFASHHINQLEASNSAELSSRTPATPAATGTTPKAASITQTRSASIVRTAATSTATTTGTTTSSNASATNATTAAAAADVATRSLTISPTTTPATTQIVVISDIIKICDKDIKVKVTQQDGQASFTMETECTTCDVKSGSFAAIDPKLLQDTQELQKLLAPKIQTAECKITVAEPEEDYDQRLSACAAETTKTKQRNCFLNAIKNVSFEIGSDGNPYASLSEFIETLSGSTAPITDWIKSLINSREESDITMAKDSSNKVLAAMTKTLDNARNFFNKKKRISSDENKELSTYKNEIKKEIGNLKLAAEYKTDENALFGRTQELVTNAADMFSKYAAQPEESKSKMSGFIRNYESLLNNPMYSDSQKNSYVNSEIARLAAQGPAVSNEVSILKNWVGLMSEKQNVATELKNLQNNNLKPILAVSSTDLKTDLQKSFKEVELANQKITLTDAKAIADVDQINRPGVVTSPVNLFEQRSDPKVGLARLGGSSLNTAFPSADSIYNSDLSKMFSNSTYGPGTIGVAPIDGNTAVNTGSPATAAPLVFHPTGTLPAAGDRVASGRP